MPLWVYGAVCMILGQFIQQLYQINTPLTVILGLLTAGFIGVGSAILDAAYKEVIRKSLAKGEK